MLRPRDVAGPWPSNPKFYMNINIDTFWILNDVEIDCLHQLALNMAFFCGTCRENGHLFTMHDLDDFHCPHNPSFKRLAIQNSCWNEPNPVEEFDVQMAKTDILRLLKPRELLIVVGEADVPEVQAGAYTFGQPILPPRRILTTLDLPRDFVGYSFGQVTVPFAWDLASRRLEGILQLHRTTMRQEVMTKYLGKMLYHFDNYQRYFSLSSIGGTLQAILAWPK